MAALRRWSEGVLADRPRRALKRPLMTSLNLF